MKGRYLIVAVVLLMSVLVLTLPGASEDVAGEPASYQDLDPQTRVPIGSTYCDDMPLTEGGTDPSEMVKVRSDATGNNYIGYYEGNLYLVLDAPAWTQGQEENLPSFSIVFQETTYEIRAVNLSGDSSVTVLKMGGDSSGPTVEPIAGGLYVGSSSAPVITKSYCVLTSNDRLIYDASLEKFVGSANIKNHVVTVEEPTTLEMGNGVYGTDFTGGAITVSITENEVTYSAEMQPLIEGQPSSATGYKLGFVNITGYPLQFSHSDTSGTYSMLIHYTDTSGNDISVQCDSVENYGQNIYFNAAKPGEIYLGSAANHDTALSVNNSEDLTLVYGGSGDPYYRYTGATGYDSFINVATRPGTENYHELRLLHGEVVLTQGTNMRVGGTVISAVIGSVDLMVQEEEQVSLTVAPSDTFALDGRQYVAYGDGNQTYDPYNFAEASEELHGIKLDFNQKIILGNGAMAIYDADGNQGAVERAIRNETSTSSTATTVNVENTTNPITISTGNQNVILGSYLVVDSNLTSPVMCSVIETPFVATVDNDTGEFITEGEIGDVTVLEAGEQLNLPGGLVYEAVSKSVFTGSDPEYVMESGQVTITSNDTTSITIRRPDNSTLTITGASQVTAGESSTFLFGAGDISIGDSSYLAVTESQFTLDSSDVLRMAYGRVTVPQGGSVTVPGTSYDMTFTAPADSEGTIQFATDPRRAVSIYSGVFEVSISTGNYSCTIYLMAEGSGIAYDGATFTYADGQADLDIYGGTVRLTGSSQSVSFDGEILTASRRYTSVGNPATIRTGASSEAIPTLTAGSVLTESDIIVNGISLYPTWDATITSTGTVTLAASKDITATATIEPPQGEPVTYTYSYTNSSEDSLILSFEVIDDRLVSTLLSGSVRISTGTPITVAGNEYTATTSNAVLTLDNGAMVLQSGIVSATSHVWNGVLIEAVDSTFRIDSSLNRITFSASAYLKFRGEDPVYTFNTNHRFMVTSDGKVLLTDGTSLIMAEGGSIYLGTEGKNYLVENIDDETVFVSSAYTVTGIGDGKSVRISSGTSSATVTRNGGSSDVSVSIYPSDGSLYLGGGSGIVMAANLVLNNMAFRNSGHTVTGTGTLTVESRSDAVTATYVSGTFDVNGPMLFDTITVSGEFSVAPDDTLSVITVPVSKSVTVTPDGEDPTEYANASSTDPLLIEYNSKTFTIYPSSGEYYVKANTAVSVGGVCDVTLLSEESADTMVVGVGNYNYVIFSNGQQAEFSSMEDSTSFTYTAAANGTRFDVIGRPGEWNALLTAGAASFGSDGDRDTLSLTDYTRTLTYTSDSGAVIATHVADSALYAKLVSGTATFPADGGTSLIVANTEFLAAGGPATLSVSGDTPVLVDGGVDLSEGTTISVGGVSITNLGDSDTEFYPSVEVHYDSSEGTRYVVFDREGITISTHVTADYSFTSSSNCQVSVADDGRISASAGVFTLDDGKSITVGTVTVTSSGTSVISVDGEDFSVRSGSLTFSPAASFSVAGVDVSGAVSVTMSDSITVSAPANGTIEFTSTTTYSYTNASATDPLVLEGNIEGGIFSPKSGSYYVYCGAPATVNGVTVSAGGQTGDSIVVDAGSNTVTLSSGKTVTFSNDTAVTYNAASDGTSFTVNSINDLPLISGSVSLSQSQGILIGGTTYTAVSAPSVISSDNGTAVLVSGPIAVPAGKSIKVGSNSYTAGDKQATVSASDGVATLVAETVILPAGASIKIGDVTVLNNGTVDFEISASGDALLPQNAKIRATLGSTSSDLTASSETQVLVRSDGKIVIMSAESLALAQGESAIIGDTIVHADTAAELSVNDGVIILLSGTVSLTAVIQDAPTSIRVNDIDITGASSASKGTSTYVVGPAGEAIEIDGKSYQNASQTQTIKFTYADTAFVLSEGSYSTTVSSNAPVNVNGYLIFSGLHNDDLDITVGPDTVAADGTIPIKIQKNEVSWTYGYPTGAVFTLGTDAVLTSGSVTVSESIILVIGTTVYTAENGDAVLSASSGKATLVSGDVAVPEGASVTVMGTEFTAYDDAGIIGYVDEDEDYVNITQGGFEIASADDLLVYLGEPGSQFRVGSSTFAYSDSSYGLRITGTTATLISIEPWVVFNGSVTIGGVVYQSDGEASICFDGTSCSLSSGTVSFTGTSASPVPFTVGSKDISVDSDVKIGITEDQGSAVIRIHSGSFTASSEMQIAAGSSAFTVTQGVKVVYSSTATTFTVPASGSVTYPDAQSGDSSNVVLLNNGSASIVFVYETMTLTMPADTGVRNGGDTFTSGPEETVVVLGSPLTLKSGSVALSRGQSVVIGESTYSAVSSATLGVRSGNAVLITGSVTIGGVQVSYSGSVDDYLLLPSDGRISVAEGKSVSFYVSATGDSCEYIAGTGGAVFLVSDSKAVFESGDIKMSKGTYADVGGAERLRAYGESTEISRDSSGNVTLVSGGLEFPAGDSVIVNGSTFRAVDAAATMEYGQSVRLVSGTVSVSGGFGIDVSEFRVSVEGSDTVTKIAAGESSDDIPTAEIDSASGCTFAVGTSDRTYVYHVTKAGFELSTATEVSSGDGTAGGPTSESSVPKVILTSGSATLGNDAAIYARKTDGSFIKFDMVGDRAVSVAIADGKLRVTVASGSVNLTDEIDPTYENIGANDLTFTVGDSKNIELDSGSVSIPVGSTVKVGDRYVTNSSRDGGRVEVNEQGIVTVYPNSSADISNDEGYSKTISNNTSEPINRDANNVEEDEAYTTFGDHKKWLIEEVGRMDANTQAVKRLIDSTVLSLEGTVYDSSKSLSDNEAVLDAIFSSFLDEYEALYIPDQELFEKYKDDILARVEKLHDGETSLTESRMIASAYEAIGQMTFDDNRSYAENIAAMDSVLAQLEEGLKPYRSSGDAAFSSYRAVLLKYVSDELNYVSDQPEAVYPAISSLVSQYDAALREMQYLVNLDSDNNLQRLTDLRNAFDRDVYGVYSTEYLSHRTIVLAEMNSLYSSYPSPTAKDLIDSAVSKISSRNYDRKTGYTDNINVVDDLLDTLKDNLSTTLIGNISTFNAYCDAFLKRYDKALADYTALREEATEPEEIQTIDKILGWITEARNSVDPAVEGHLAYDSSKSLNDNINAVFNIASGLEKKINDELSDQISNELDRVYEAANDHLDLNDREGVPSKLLKYISSTRAQLKGVYEGAETDLEKGASINTIMATYNDEMAVLIKGAEYYLNVDQGIKYLKERYSTSYSDVKDMLAGYITALEALEFDPETDDMTQKLSELQETVNTYSVNLANLRKTTAQGEFENYREYLVWNISKTLAANASDAEKALVDQYSASIRAVQFDGKSAQANKYAVDRLADEFNMRHLELVASQRAAEFETLKETRCNDLDAMLSESDGEPVRAAAATAKSWITAYTYEQTKSYYDNSRALEEMVEAATLHIRYLRACSGTASSDINDPVNALFSERLNVLSTTPYTAYPVLNGYREKAIADINAIIADSTKTQAEKSALIEKIDSDFVFTFFSLAEIKAEIIVGDSAEAKTIIDSAYSGMMKLAYRQEASPADNRATVEAFMAKFREDLYQQRLLDNSVTVGGIGADGKAANGGTAEYPEGSTEIWGILANVNGLGNDPSARITRVDPTVDLTTGNVIPATGSTVNVLSGGKVLGAFDVALYNGNERAFEFSGMYCVKILLPEDMRGMSSVQVAYVDEFGDIQVYDAKVEGNYLVFETDHFSTFYMLGNVEIHSYYDVYLYLLVAVVIIILTIYYLRIVRYDANGGTGKTPAIIFFGNGEGSMPASGFSRDGYTFAGWSRKADGSDPIPADSDISALGSIHFIKLYAIWSETGREQQ